jgi:hypothetical protein
MHNTRLIIILWLVLMMFMALLVVMNHTGTAAP